MAVQSLCTLADVGNQSATVSSMIHTYLGVFKSGKRAYIRVVMYDTMADWFPTSARVHKDLCDTE